MKKKIIVLFMFVLMIAGAVAIAGDVVPGPFEPCSTILQNCEEGLVCSQNPLLPPGNGICIPE